MVEKDSILCSSIQKRSCMNLIDNWFRTIAFQSLEGLNKGHLIVNDGEGTTNFGDPAEITAEITVENSAFYRKLLLQGHLGASEAFAKGWWHTPDLTKVIQLLLRHRSILDGLETGPTRLLHPIRNLLNTFRRNNPKGSLRNIALHYDLGNELFQEFLDETLSYSCAYFETEHTSLKEASLAKYDRICRKLQITKEDRIIEIGTGWGGFAIHASTNYGCHVTTTTISRNQYEYVSKLIEAKGLQDKIELLFQDYRELQGEFDHLVSIEMIEAIGHDHYPIFFKKCSSLLTEQGMAAIQTITIQNRYYEQARREVDFIKAYIFPGSCIPSVSALFNAMSPTDLRLINSENIGPHYAKTLRLWRENFFQNRTELFRLGYDDAFQKIWNMYFSYCEGGFLEGVLEDHQLVFAKPSAALDMYHSTQDL